MSQTLKLHKNIKRVLFTGISGFIGRHVARGLLDSDYQITAIVRPNTDPKRIQEFAKKVDIEKIDLSDIHSLESFLNKNQFDYILHIGALRGGRNFFKTDFYKVNVIATEQLVIYALTQHSNFIFCSSVGVFGAIPKELPATETTPRQEDNYYHYTKIEAEKIIHKFVQKGLKAAIVRPAITYGIGDYGFPYMLMKLVDKKTMLLPKKRVMIHLTHVDTLSDAFYQLMNIAFKPGSTYIVADRNPVELSKFVDFISWELSGKSYPRNRRIPAKFFDWSILLAHLLKNELWTSRFELISRSWYYDSRNIYHELKLEPRDTIPAFKVAIDWYKELR